MSSYFKLRTQDASSSCYCTSPDLCSRADSREQSIYKIAEFPTRPGLARRCHAAGHKFQYSCFHLGSQETGSEQQSRHRSLVEEGFQKIHLQGSEESRFGQKGNNVGTAVTNIFGFSGEWLGQEWAFAAVLQGVKAWGLCFSTSANR